MFKFPFFLHLKKLVTVLRYGATLRVLYVCYGAECSIFLVYKSTVTSKSVAGTINIFAQADARPWPMFLYKIGIIFGPLPHIF